MNNYKKILLSITSVMLIAGCSTAKPKPPAKRILNKNLEGVHLNGSISSMNAIAFEWKFIEDDNVKGYYIYRSSPDSNSTKLSRIAVYNQAKSTHYVDTNLKPAQEYKYRFSTYDKDFHESKLSATLVTSTLPAIEPVALFKNIDNLPRQAKLIWRPHPYKGVSGYEIQRRDGVEDGFKTIATLSNALNSEYIDYNLKDESEYYYRMRAFTFDGVYSQYTPMVKVTTKALPKKVAITSITTDKPKAIEIEWSPSQAEDFAYYKLYRSDLYDGEYEYLAKLSHNKFEDIIEEDGKMYFYKVAVVDTDGLESQASKVMKGQTLAIPKAPIIKHSEIKNHNAIIEYSGDERTRSYKIIKTEKSSFLSSKTEVIEGIGDTQYVDTALKPNVKYIYEVIAVDEFHLESKPSNPVTLFYEEQE